MKPNKLLLALASFGLVGFTLQAQDAPEVPDAPDTPSIPDAPDVPDVGEPTDGESPNYRRPSCPKPSRW